MAAPDPREHRDVRVGILHPGALRLQALEQLHGGGFAHVVHVLLVGDAQDQDPCAAHRLAAAVERLRELLHHVVRHGVVDLAGQLDEARVHPELARLPRQVEGVDGDAMAAQARARVVGHEAEGLGGGRVDDLEQVDAHALADHLQLVDQADVHRAMDVLQQLGHLGHARGADRHDPVHGQGVKGLADGPAGRRHAADQLGDVARVELRVARILPLGREDQEQVLADREAAALDDRLQDLLGGPRPGGAFQGDQLPAPQVRRHRLGGADHVRQVRLPHPVERGGHADDQRIGLAGQRKIGGGAQAGGPGGPDRPVRDVVDVAAPGLEPAHLGGVDVEADDADPRLGEAQGQRQADVAEAEDADGRAAAGVAGELLGRQRVLLHGPLG
jgi:hypothetical protein